MASSDATWHVYLLRCADDTLYCGVTTDLDRRLAQHNGRLAGGARYTHGGALPQEFVVPVLRVHSLSGKSAAQDILKQVEVCLLGQPTRIVNNIQKFEFIQTEKVSERCLPRKLLVSLSDGKESISDEKKLIFDSVSEDMENRKKSVKLALKNRTFDSRATYWLILRDEETQVEYLRVGMTIDLTFQNLF